MKQSIKVANWLESIDNKRAYEIKNVTPVTVTIGRTTYQGAKYQAVYENYSSDRIYLLCDDLPPSYKHNPGSLRTSGLHYVDQDNNIWYVSGYMIDDLLADNSLFCLVRPTMTYEQCLEEFNQYHPYGKNFGLVMTDKLPRDANTMSITINSLDSLLGSIVTIQPLPDKVFSGRLTSKLDSQNIPVYQVTSYSYDDFWVFRASEVRDISDSAIMLYWSDSNE